jgi:nickel-dependent lactate racemase
MIDQATQVRVNREVLRSDATLLVGPVFPHELIGFSGGHKYLFPGVSGPEMVDTTHWLGALMGNLAINGVADTPPRALIEAAADLVPGERHALCLVMKGGETHGVYLGEVRDSWRAAVALSERLNIIRVPRAYQTVVSCVPPRYEDLWTGSKCMSKLEPVVADGGTLILWGPHIRSPAVSFEGGGWHERVGYHVRDWILAHRERYRDVPLAVLADLIQLRGAGSYVDGVERPRIRVILATGIPAELCRKINLEYRDPRSLRIEELEGREPEGILVVHDAGEALYRLAQP